MDTWLWETDRWRRDDRPLFNQTIRSQLPDHVHSVLISDFNYDGAEDYLLAGAAAASGTKSSGATYWLVMSGGAEGTAVAATISQPFAGQQQLESQPLLISLEMRSALLFQTPSGTFVYTAAGGMYAYIVCVCVFINTFHWGTL